LAVSEDGAAHIYGKIRRNEDHPGSLCRQDCFKTHGGLKIYFGRAVTIGPMRPFRWQRHPPLSKQIRRDQFAMTISARVACGISAASIALSLLLGPAACAEDKMGKDSMMKKDTMSKDSMKKDTMSKDSMKKDDAMKKDSMKKDDVKK
jgi:pentapeptide MXKDX repeat protein